MVNIQRSGNPSDARLHHARCRTVSGINRRRGPWTGAYVKVCSADLASLDAWALVRLLVAAEYASRRQRIAPWRVTPQFKGQALLALTDAEVVLVKLKQGAISAKPTEIVARQGDRGDPGQRTDPESVNHLRRRLAWSTDVPHVIKKQGDTDRVVELLGG